MPNSKAFAKYQNTVYKANLQRCGAIIAESLILLEEYNKNKDWNYVKEKAITQNILSKKSSITIDAILRGAKSRFYNVNGLPKMDELSLFVSSKAPEKAKVQALFPYICITDTLVHEIMQRLVEPSLNSVAGESTLSKEKLLDFLVKESQTHPELNKWSDYLKKRWIRGLLSLLRDFDLMQSAPGFKLSKPALRIETFAFFCLWLLFSGKSGIEVMQNEIWSIFFLSAPEIEQLLESSQRRGWITYYRAGEIISIGTDYKSLEEWSNALG